MQCNFIHCVISFSVIYLCKNVSLSIKIFLLLVSSSVPGTNYKIKLSLGQITIGTTVCNYAVFTVHYVDFILHSTVCTFICYRVLYKTAV